MKRSIILSIGLVGMVAAQVPDFTPPTPLIGAVMRNNTAQAMRLLAAGADPNEVRPAGFPAIFFPVVFRNSELFRAMVAKGADVQARDASGSTALMWAALNEAGDPVMVEELLRLGVDPNAKNRAGETALTWAARRGNAQAVMALARAGAANPDRLGEATKQQRASVEKETRTGARQ